MKDAKNALMSSYVSRQHRRLLLKNVLVVVFSSHMSLCFPQNAPTRDPLNGKLVEMIDKTVTAFKKSNPLKSNTPPWVIGHFLIAFGNASYPIEGPNGIHEEMLMKVYCESLAPYAMTNTIGGGDRKVFFPLHYPSWFFLQDHPGQILFFLSHGGCPIDSVVTRSGKVECRVRDLLGAAKRDFRASDNNEFSVYSLLYYEKPSEMIFRNHDGDSYDASSIVSLLTDQKSNICFSAHQLYALTFAIHKDSRDPFLNEGVRAKLRAQVSKHYLERYGWLEASLLRNDITSIPWDLEKPLPWNEGGIGENSEDHSGLLDMQRIHFEGHNLEWMALYRDISSNSMPDLAPLIEAMCTRISGVKALRKAWEYGALCHALHALEIYKSYQLPIQGRRDDDRRRP
jgi:hypothetical protein